MADLHNLPPSIRWTASGLTLVLTFLLFDLGARPFAAGLIPAPWDKLAHFAAYAGLALLLSIATRGTRPALVVFATGAIGILDELHQIGIPGRSADGLDLLTDVCAAACVVMFIEVVGRRRASAA